MSPLPLSPQSGPEEQDAGRSRLKFGRIDAAMGAVERAIDRACDRIFSKQQPEGYWCGELEADSMLEADYVFIHALLGTGDPGRLERAITEMLRYQNGDGGWSIYPGGPSNISLAVKCYFACKLMGHSAAAQHMVRARTWILDNGGVVECNTFTKIYLVHARSIRLGRGAGGAARDRAYFAELVLLQYLRDQLLVARDPGAAYRLSMRKRPSRRSRRSRGSKSSLSAAVRTRTCTCAGTAKRLLSWRNFFLFSRTAIVHWAERVHIRPLRSDRAEKVPKSGCLRAWRCRTAWGRSTRRC